MLMEDREMFLSVRTWAQCLVLKDREMLFLFMYLDSLLVDDREMLLSAHPWTAGGGQGDGRLCSYLDSLLVEDREMLPSVFT